MPPDNPYAPPSAPVRDPQPAVPGHILKQIKEGWIAALISAAITFAVTLFAIFGKAILNFSAYELVDVALMCGLAYGIYRKSRTCAVLMFLYFVASKIYLMSQSGASSGIYMGIIFAYYFWRAVAGTFAYHKFMQQTAAAPSHG